MTKRKMPYKSTCPSCGKQQGNCFAYCVICGTKLTSNSDRIAFHIQQK